METGQQAAQSAWGSTWVFGARLSWRRPLLLWRQAKAGNRPEAEKSIYTCGAGPRMPTPKSPGRAAGLAWRRAGAASQPASQPAGQPGGRGVSFLRALTAPLRTRTQGTTGVRLKSRAPAQLRCGRATLCLLGRRTCRPAALTTPEAKQWQTSRNSVANQWQISGKSVANWLGLCFHAQCVKNR